MPRSLTEIVDDTADERATGMLRELAATHAGAVTTVTWHGRPLVRLGPSGVTPLCAESTFRKHRATLRKAAAHHLGGDGAEALDLVFAGLAAGASNGLQACLAPRTEATHAA